MPRLVVTSSCIIFCLLAALACPAQQLLSRASKTSTLSLGTRVPNHAEVQISSVQSPIKDEIKRLTSEVERLGSEGKYDEALPLAERALKLSETEWGTNNAAIILPLNNLAELSGAKGDYTKAKQLFMRALSIRRFSPHTELELAQSLNNLAGAYFANAEYTEAEPLLLQALAIRERALASDHPDVAESLNNLGALYKAKGDYEKAEPLYQRALLIREKVQGKYHPDVMEPLNNLAQVYRAQGNNVEAEPLLARALEIVERDKGRTHPDVVPPLNNLAILYVETGDYSRGEELLLRGLKIREDALGAEHPLVAQSLHNLGTLYYEENDYAKAEPYIRRALEIKEKKLPATHPDIAYSLNVLASLYYKQKKFAKAESLVQRSLTIREGALGDKHPLVAADLNNLAAIYKAQGTYEKAESLYQRAVAIYERFSSEHPDVAVVLGNLADLYRIEGHIKEAIQIQARANDINERNINLNLAAGSERRKLLYLSTLTAQMDQTISLHLQSASDSADARRLALLEILRRKGRVLDTLTNNIYTLRRHFGPQNRLLLDHLIDTRSKLASMILRGPGKSSVVEYQQETRQLRAQADRLEANISARSTEFRTQTSPVSLHSIQEAIPSDAALVEFSLYRPHNTADDQKIETAHYVAYVLTKTGEPKSVDLGEQPEVDDLVNKLRAALRAPHLDKEQYLRQVAQLAEARVMRPVRRLLNDKTRILVSPDGALNLIPFGVLVDEDNHYLVEKYSFVYLTSGRDLLRLNSKLPSRQPAIVMAAPFFDQIASTRSTSPAKTLSARRSREFSERFEALEGTSEEGLEVSKLLGVKPLMAKSATELRIKRLRGPRMLHVATHGFFLPRQEVPSREIGLLSNSQFSMGLDENPLLRSGLALAGANQLQGGNGEDGILTALEASGLDLWGTKLVVLSACDTGLGSVKDGEGVYGLRRALVLAGAESQVISLWKVDDGATRDLMIQYYKRLRRGQGRAEAMRQVQLKMLDAKPYSHPYFWAGFIESGDWRALTNK